MEEFGHPSMRTQSTAIHGATGFEVRAGGSVRQIRRALSPVHWIGAVLLVSVLAGPACAEEAWNPFSRAPLDPIEQGKTDAANDPAELLNREIFKVNKFFDDYVFKPAARAYAAGLSSDVRQSLHNFTNNIGEPVTLINDVLQGNAERAWNTTQRFAVNSTVGIAGFRDVAATWGREYHYADLGRLSAYGVWGRDPSYKYRCSGHPTFAMRSDLGRRAPQVASLSRAQSETPSPTPSSARPPWMTSTSGRNICRTRTRWRRTRKTSMRRSA